VDYHQRSVNKFTSEDKFYSSIGRFIFEFSQLEYTIRYRLAEHIGLKDEFFDTFMSHDFSMLCNIAERVLLGVLASAEIDPELDPLAKGSPPAILQKKKESPDKCATREREVKELITDCRNLGSERNRIVHGLWYIAEQHGVLYHTPRHKLVSALHYDDDAISLAQMADRANKLDRIFVT
jgi:hypothetical protein